MQALSTVYTPPAWCAQRYAVFIAPAPSSSTIPPSSGWVDPSFPRCVPAQYQTPYPTFSPGVCPANMQMVGPASSSRGPGGPGGAVTVWTGRCCQSGFTTVDGQPDWMCTSSVTTPMAFLLDPNISTADLATTLSGVWVNHDQVTVLWQASDLALLPREVASSYAALMGGGGAAAAAASTLRPTLAGSPTSAVAGSGPGPGPLTAAPTESSLLPGPDAPSSTSSGGRAQVAATSRVRSLALGGALLSWALF